MTTVDRISEERERNRGEGEKRWGESEAKRDALSRAGRSEAVPFSRRMSLAGGTWG